MKERYGHVTETTLTSVVQLTRSGSTGYYKG
jgi:hypothetical protein